MFHQNEKSITLFRSSSSNPMKSYTPFISLRVSTNSYNPDELNSRMTELIFKLETVYTSLEEEEMMTDTLKFMKNDMRNQNHCDRMKINNIMPNVRDLENSLETLA